MKLFRRSSRAGRSRGKARQQRVYLHVGAPKTGTTYLQDLLWANRERAAAAGVLYPGHDAGAHHSAALDLRDAQLGAPNPAVDGAWDRLTEEAHRWKGDVVVSSELLAWATPEQAQRAIDSFASRFEVHVVFTARDLARQVPAVWQEEVKNRGRMDYPTFLTKLIDPATPAGGPAGIWGGQDPRLVMASWAAPLPPHQVHIVPVPPSQGSTDTLLQRFCSVVGLDPVDYEGDAGPSNVGLGFAEAEFLRRVNAALPQSFAWGDYRPLIKEGLALDPLAAHRRDSKPPLPSEVVGALGERTAAIMTYVRDQGFTVTGDLSDLSHGTDAELAQVGDLVVDEQRVAAAGVDVTTALLVQLARTRSRLREASRSPKERRRLRRRQRARGVVRRLRGLRARLSRSR